jgi:hypothetical protein
MSVLDRLERLEHENRKAVYSGEGFEFEALVLNNARDLIDVAKAATLLIEEIRLRPFSPDTWVISELKQALERLDK